ncbi:MAG: hypothetical protein IKD70_03235, partial [Eggerthellaceae bacterium]|nr:hypothetical protein [Eggerthellaceae bacterium]
CNNSERRTSASLAERAIQLSAAVNFMRKAGFEEEERRLAEELRDLLRTPGAEQHLSQMVMIFSAASARSLGYPAQKELMEKELIVAEGWPADSEDRIQLLSLFENLARDNGDQEFADRIMAGREKSVQEEDVFSASNEASRLVALQESGEWDHLGRECARILDALEQNGFPTADADKEELFFNALALSSVAHVSQVFAQPHRADIVEAVANALAADIRYIGVYRRATGEGTGSAAVCEDAAGESSFHFMMRVKLLVGARRALVSLESYAEILESMADSPETGRDYTLLLASAREELRWLSQWLNARLDDVAEEDVELFFTGKDGALWKEELLSSRMKVLSNLISDYQRNKAWIDIVLIAPKAMAAASRVLQDNPEEPDEDAVSLILAVAEAFSQVGDQESALEAFAVLADSVALPDFEAGPSDETLESLRSVMGVGPESDGKSSGEWKNTILDNYQMLAAAQKISRYSEFIIAVSDWAFPGGILRKFSSPEASLRYFKLSVWIADMFLGISQGVIAISPDDNQKERAKEAYVLARQKYYNLLSEAAKHVAGFSEH